MLQFQKTPSPAFAREHVAGIFIHLCCIDSAVLILALLPVWRHTDISLPCSRHSRMIASTDAYICNDHVLTSPIRSLSMTIEPPAKSPLLECAQQACVIEMLSNLIDLVTACKTPLGSPDFRDPDDANMRDRGRSRGYVRCTLRFPDLVR
ncbi:uncharacterized protein ARMOST_20192 [Armillaria ostoyae]|uniref:Uncharacterized protein n=1 Tax=Armillaria ostoyae TaxID=47428 RepID=A0A284S6P1_ARMOS|nr:uncharacterized protein ARMOST_20192 [Armillaria ostoyae]